MPIRTRFAHKSIFHKKILAILAIFLITAVVTVGGFVIAEILDVSQPIEIEKNTELTYYLHVKYDGVDVSGTESSDSQMANVQSDRILVTDTLPKGLTFKGFVTSADGSFGAFSRADSSVSCGGHVIDDSPEGSSATEGSWDTEHKNFQYHGLHYNEDTRLVSFYVEHLKAGCQIDVGIITQTPATVDDLDTPEPETRRDFYNTAFAQEGGITARSNTVHVFMGELNVQKYKVYYHYTNPQNVPDGAPELPEEAEYVKNSSVVIEPDLELDGYDFTGWTTNDVTVPTGSNVFTITNEVHFYGDFIAKVNPTTYHVYYEVRTEDPTNDPLPIWAIAPRSGEYEAGDEVTVDSTIAGIYDGYEFSGWLKQADGTATNSKPTTAAGTGFIMPEHDVYIYGYYKRKSYTVTYQFEGSIIPDNADELLPEVETHYPGETVTTAANPTAPSGYRFLGWYKGETFKMPEEDIIIYGEWGLQSGSFEPLISKSVVDPQPSYTAEDTVTFKVTLCNTANHEIHDVILQEQLAGAKFTTDGATLYAYDSANHAPTGTGSALSVTLAADSIIRINSIAAESCGVVYSTFDILTVAEEDVTNTVEMIGALADNNYNLDTSHPYVATADFHIAQLNEPPVPSGAASKNMFIFLGLVIIAIAGGGVVILNRRKS